jgi:transcriptional regulator with XRE-family HTH domain
MLYAQKAQRTKSVPKSPRKLRTFHSDAYLAQLMGELDRAAISVRLAQARAEVALSQSEMAELLTVHLRSVQNYESPKVNVIPFDRLEQWAQITGRTKEWLLHGDQPRIVADDRLEAIEEELRRVTAGLDRLEEILHDMNKELARLRP